MRTHNLFRIINILILLALVFAPLTPASSRPAEVAQPEMTLDYAPDRLLARLRDGYTASKSEAEALGVQSMQPLFRGADLPAGLAQVVRLDLLPGSDVRGMAEALGQDARFEWVEPDYLAHAIDTQGVTLTPNDTLFPQQWGLTKIGAPAAWDVQTGSPTVTIAIVDSGIDRTHADLQPNLWVNPGEVAGNGIDDDNNGLVDDVHGWDFVNEDNDPADDNGHGTQVAGVASAATNNGTGIAGACWHCKLMAVKVMSILGTANYSDIAQGVIYAAQKGAKVINLSLGGYSFSSALLEAVQYALNEKNAVVVAGAGNDDTDAPFYPAAYTEVIAVAGTDQDDHKSAISNFGEWVDLAAPAVDIQTTFMGGSSYGPVDGTSMSAPFVSGVAGLLLSEHSDWSSALVRLQMQHTADPLDTLNPSYAGLLGSGRIDAGSALTTAPHPLLTISEKLVNGDPLGRPTPGESATLELTLTNDWLDAFGVTGKLSTTDATVTITQANADFGSILAGNSGTGSPAYTFSVALAAGYDHPISFTLQLTANGGAYTASLAFTIKTRSAEEQVGGTIGENTTWTNDKTYIVTSNVGVAPDATLTIEPGTDVLFNGEYSLNVGGQLIADGTEAAPIRFLSNTGSAWGRIYFDDQSVDATADPEGNYLGGNILRWVVVEQAGQGIGCNNATPYLSHLTTDGGGVSCAMGLTPVWLEDSELTGSTAFSYNPLVGACDTLDSTYGVAVVGEYAYVADWDNGLRVIDVSDPSHPAEIGFYDTPGYANDVFISNGYAYVADGPSGLRVIDITDPTNPTEIGFNETPDHAYSVVVSGDYAYMVIGSSGLRILDVHDPADPIVVGAYDPPGESWGIDISGSLAYIADSTSGLRVINVSDPTNPYEVGFFDTQEQAWDVAVSGDYAYVADYYGGLRVINVSDPANPVEDGFYDNHYYAYAVTVSGSFAYVADGGMMHVIDISDPSYPFEVGSEYIPGVAYDVTVSDRYVYVANLDGGLYIFRARGTMNVSVLDTTLHSGDLTLPDSSLVQNSIVGGSINTVGNSVVQATIANGIITTSNGQVLSSTITGGGISAGDGSLVQGNKIENSPSYGIQTSGTVTVQGNLVANSAGVGLEINGDVSVSDNTFIGNAGNTIVINAGVPTIQGNNLEGNTGEYDIQNLTANNIPADGNWWGTTNDADINLRIFDSSNDYNYGSVLYPPAATGAIQSAPAYVRSVTLDPASPVGIETVTFEVEFSRLMDVEISPQLSFLSVLQNTWTLYNSSNTGLFIDGLRGIATDPDGSHWFTVDYAGVVHFDGITWTFYDSDSTGLPSFVVTTVTSDRTDSHWFGTYVMGAVHFDNINWTVYNTENSGLPSNSVGKIFTDPDGSHWFATGAGVAHFDGTTWTVYDTSNSGLPVNSIADITRDSDGSHWFGTTSGLAHFDGANWVVYNTSNSGLPSDKIGDIITEPDGSHWFCTDNGVVYFDGTDWTVYNTSNSGLPSNIVRSIATDLDGSHWFGTEGGIAHFDGTNWMVYNTSNSELPVDRVFMITSEADGSQWITSYNGGVAVLWNFPTHIIQDNPLWLDDTHYQASFDITSLVTLGDYRLTVAGAIGADDIQIAPDTATTFTVDYAGAVSDTSAPSEPSVLACGADTPDTLSASWSAYDPETAITLYQYAIGTTSGGSDIVYWTNTGETSFLRDNLSLLAGQTYYVSVKARNEGGLWSEAGISSGVVAGSGTCPVAGFTADVLSGEAPLTVQFSDDSSGEVTGWTWDFGDGIISTQPNPEHVYTEAGIYTVALLVSGPGGSDLETKVGYITVYPGDISYFVTLPLVSK